MNKSQVFKQALPHIAAIAVFILVNLLLYAPIFLENKTINQNDVLQGLGGGQETHVYRQATGEEGLWNNSMFSGMPGYLINIYWSGDYLQYLFNVATLGLPSPATHTFMAMLCFYILLLVFRVNPLLAIAGGLVYGANPYFIILVEAGHIWKVAAISVMPLVLAGIELAFRKKYLWGFIITAMAMAMEIRSNHLQMTYYLLLIVLIYGLIKLIEARRNKTIVDFSKTSAVLVLAVLLAVGANLGRMWTSYEYSKYSIRGAAELTAAKQASSGGLDRDYAFRWSNGIWEPLTLLVPYFYGGGTVESLDMKSTVAKGLLDRGVAVQQVKGFVERVPTYWGDQPFTSGPAYIGAIMVFLFVLGLFVIKGSLKWWLLIATLFTIVLSWGSNFAAFNYLMFDYFPGYNKFRAVASIIIIPLLTIPFLGMVALQEVVNDGWKKHQKHLLYSFAIVGGFCLLLVLASGMLGFKSSVDSQFAENPWLVDLIRDQRGALLRGDAIRSAILISLVILLLYYFGKQKISLVLASILFVALVGFDIIAVDKRYLREDNFVKNLQKIHFAPSEADKRIKQDKDLHYRVLNLNDPFNEAKTSYHHASIGGYHGAKMRRYQDLIEARIQSDMSSAIQSLQSGAPDLAGLGTLNMLNTKYIKFGDNAAQVILNESALGNAWFVSSVKTVNSPDEEIALLGEIETGTEAVVDISKFSISGSNFGSGTITLTEYKPNYLKYNATVNEKGLAIFSEIYYPVGWEAYIDGQPADILRANYVLRALEIPSGTHVVEFKFVPKAYSVGNGVMGVCTILLLLLIVAGVGYEIKKARY